MFVYRSGGSYERLLAMFEYADGVFLEFQQGEVVSEWLATVFWKDCTSEFWHNVRDLHHSGNDERALALIMEHTLSK